MYKERKQELQLNCTKSIEETHLDSNPLDVQCIYASDITQVTKFPTLSEKCYMGSLKSPVLG